LQPENQLHFKRLEDVNVNCNIDAAVSSVRFHATSQSLLAASSDNLARIFTKKADNTYTLANTLSVEVLLYFCPVGVMSFFTVVGSFSSQG